MSQSDDEWRVAGSDPEALQRLKSENQELMQQNASLSAQLSALREASAKDQKIISQLQNTKIELSSELEELAKKLFDEANVQVGNVLKEKHAICIQNQILQKELASSKDLVTTLQEQLRCFQEYTNRDQGPASADSTLSPTSIEGGGRAVGGTAPFQLISKTDDLLIFLPESAPSSPTNPGLSIAVATKESIYRSLDNSLYSSFLNFLHNSESHPNAFVKRLYSLEVASTILGSYAHLRLPEKKIFDALKHGTLSLERFKPSDSTDSLLLASPSLPVLPDEAASTSKPGGIFELFSSIISFDSELPQTKSDPSLEAEPKASRRTIPCGLCDSPLRRGSLLYRLRLSPTHSWLHIDEQCRERIVAVGDLLIFLRHIKSGNYNAIPEFILWLLLLQHRRKMFYAKTCSSQFYLSCDELLFHCNKQRPL